MPRQRQRAARAQAGIHFIIADPSSSRERPDNLRIVRSHVGRWRWQQAKEKLERESSLSTGANNSSETSPRDQTSPDSETPEPSIGHTPGDFGADTDGFPWLVPEPGVSDPTYFEQNVLDEDVFTFTNQELDTSVPDFWEEQNTGNDTEFGALGCMSGISPTVLDPFQTIGTSPLPLNLVSGANKYLLWPGLMPKSSLGTTHIGVQRWFASSASNAALHSTLLYGSYSHRRALWLVKQRGHFSADDAKQMAICEADAIARINRAIKIPAEAVTDELILCVLCMATNKLENPLWEDVTESPFNAPLRSLQWLDVYGRLSPHPVHQAGLRQLVSLRGGLEKLGLPGLATVISFSGVLGASRSLARPTFPYISIRSGTRMTLKDILGIDDFSQNPKSEITEGDHVNPEMQKIFRGLRIYVELIETYQDGIQMGMDTLCDYRNVIQWHVMSLLPSTQLGSAHVGFYPLYEACRLALLTFGVGITFPLPPQTAPLASLARMLQIELQVYSQAIQNDSLEVQRLYSWCLMVGGIAGKGSSERSWYASKLQHYATSRGLSTWHEMRVELREVLWLDSACDLAGKMLWDEAMSL
ncbi:uncharacterized protein N7473_007247 [Penicillium subrubescens]|uniref:uncharacterized protein n=1 Tax=Penicillium subrubescens TaxID=1316194 RepID=UPI002545BCA9|nr:uncharacterized protein N7473_007247 [Penicillium subrubescens]KAJ5891019.1 hypothetical protein N7473_007247 [Penicillium subrubescens]